MEKYLYKVYNAIYWTEEIFVHKETNENGIIIDMKIYRVPISNKNKEGISYSLVYIKDEQRIVGFDDCEGHEKNENRHHKHINGKIIPYEFVDEWKLLSDFNEEVEKVKRGLLQ